MAAIAVTRRPRGRYASVVLAEAGLRSLWKLNEASGNFADSKGSATGTANGMTYQAAALTADGLKGATFPGSASWIDMGDNLDNTGTSPFTLECWIRPSAVGTSPHLMGKRTASADGYTLNLNGSNRVTLNRLVSSVADTTANSGTVLTTATIYHVVGVYDGTMLAVWINGTRGGTIASSASAIDLATSFKLGVRADGTINALYAGDMAHAAVYNVALSPVQIVRHYRAGRRWP